MTIETGLLKWNIKEIATALQIKEGDVNLYFTDGRRVSFILERRLAYEILNGKLAPNEGAGYDILDSNGGKWEVRSISKHGIYFCPSYMVGSGRSFELKGFLNKIEDIKGYIISDIESFPEVRFWIISVEQVKQWWESKQLGTSTKISRQKALQLIENISKSK